MAFTLRLNADLALRLKVVAAAENRTQTDIVREAVEDYLEGKGLDALRVLEETLSKGH